MEILVGAKTAYYFYRLNLDDGISEFCVAGANDPEQTVQALIPGTGSIPWDKRVEGDLLVFRPPTHREGGQGLVWAYDKRLQRGEPMSHEALDREALRNRVSVDCGGA